MFQIGQLIRSGAAAAIDLGRHVYGRASQFVDALPIGNGMSAIDRAAHLAYNAANNFAAAHPTAARVAAAAAKAAIAAAAATEFARLFSSREVSSGEMYLMCSSMAAASIQELANIALENLSEITGTLSIIPAAMVMSQAAPSFSSLLLMQSVAKLAAKEGSGIAKAAFAAALTAATAITRKDLFGIGVGTSTAYTAIFAALEAATATPLAPPAAPIVILHDPSPGPSAPPTGKAGG